MRVGQALFGYQGRLSRLAYFGYSLLLGAIFMAIFVVVCMTAGFVAVQNGTSPERAGEIAGLATAGLLLLVAIWPASALITKRLHDMGQSGAHTIWIMLLSYAGLVVSDLGASAILGLASMVASLWLLFGPGEPGPNRYGMPPGTPVMPVQPGWHPSAYPMPQPGYAPQPQPFHGYPQHTEYQPVPQATYPQAPVYPYQPPPQGVSPS